ncbi:MAG: hypothetical protein QM758_11975 [Armatimonas sp.]
MIGSARDCHATLVTPIATWIAEQDYHLLTGARFGVMEQACRDFQLARNKAGTTGQTIGILPDSDTSNKWVEILIRTHLPAGNHAGNRYQNGRDPRSCNWLEVRSADVMVALPGGVGTEAEINLAAAHGTPIVLYGWKSNPLPSLEIKAFVELNTPESPMPAFLRLPTIAVAHTKQDVFDFIEAHLQARSTPLLVSNSWPKRPTWPADADWPNPPPLP